MIDTKIPPPIVMLVFAMYISAFQIAPEERALSDLFGGQYTVYRSHLRMWL